VGALSLYVAAPEGKGHPKLVVIREKKKKKIPVIIQPESHVKKKRK